MKKKKMIKQMMAGGISRNEAEVAANVLRAHKAKGKKFAFSEYAYPIGEKIVIRTLDIVPEKLAARTTLHITELNNHPNLDVLQIEEHRLKEMIAKDIIYRGSIATKITGPDKWGYITIDAKVYVARPEVV